MGILFRKLQIIFFCVMNVVQNFLTFSLFYGTESGFGHFSAAHLWHLLLIFVFLTAFCVFYRQSGGKRKKALRLLIAGGNAALTFLRAALLIAAGQYGVERLPLHLCGMAVYICLFHALRPGRLSAQFLLAFCMPGALAAILFPDWTTSPPWSVISVFNFSIHALIACYVLMQLAAGDIRREAKLLPACLGLMLLIAAPVYAFNLASGTNFMFLNYPAPNSPLELFSFLGRPGYILGYLPMIGAVWAVIYLPRKPKLKPPSGLLG